MFRSKGVNASVPRLMHNSLSSTVMYMHELMKARASQDLAWFCEKYTMQRSFLNKCKSLRDDKINKMKKQLREALKLRVTIKEHIRSELN